jgi:hypothetical protein
MPCLPFQEPRSSTEAEAMKIVQEFILPDGGKVVRYDPPMEARSLVENIACFNVDGSLRWKKAPANNAGGQVDFFTGIQLVEGMLFANTWGCWRMAIDPFTGAESDHKFTNRPPRSNQPIIRA